MDTELILCFRSQMHDYVHCVYKSKWNWNFTQSIILLIYSESKEEGKDGKQGNSITDVYYPSHFNP